ncbi:hypothetical protein [Desulfovibrio sp. UCD-KL4C]|uniref:hypothetical protein n=1 Tax=Desulfovibrio sp. UCD-KL4C TaxID=2578120 RepID=UPI0025B8588F|nr:hypothetical protein [Desulfovibrio sp. UCD-KL4C]
MQRLEDFKQEFGNDHFVYLLVEPAEGGNTFSSLFIKKIRDLANELEADVPENTSLIAERRHRALVEDDFVGRFISQNGNVVGILLEMEACPEGVENPEALVTSKVYSILKKDKY